ncbi:MAG: TRAM domain-containing protein [Cellulomonadaceae bacterium]|jgi:tRNA/tmRNA/rRNA uracil-C5-methylase (TrmA/RlmC/RlmD family)|nr:TRAM domain-containing protein [Cellulomonadaceae bacterium]
MTTQANNGARPSQALGNGDASQELTLEIGAVAHGGHCVTRISEAGPDKGRVVFVRHALPGETVRARVTEKGKVWRADCLEVLANPSPYRVPSRWPEAGPGGVGGGELAHVSSQGQRRWKAAVVREQLQRLAGLDVSEFAPALDVDANTLEGESPGVESVSEAGYESGYRTRIEFVTDENGHPAMAGHRSNQFVPLASVPLATPALADFLENKGTWRGELPSNSRLTAVVPNGRSAAEGVLLAVENHPTPKQPTPKQPTQNNSPAPQPNAKHPKRPTSTEPITKERASTDSTVVETVQLGDTTYQYQVAADGFWQVHDQAPAWLVQWVLEAAALSAGQRVLDLYAGAGLFTVPLAAAVGPGGEVKAVEGDREAVANAALNAKEYPQVSVINSGVLQALTPRRKNSKQGTKKTRKESELLSEKPYDVVVLDPPRVGAGQQVIQKVAALKPKRIVYVACDPAALARDIAYLAPYGYRMTALKAADLFPHTHHVECVATLELTLTN